MAKQQRPLTLSRAAAKAGVSPAFARKAARMGWIKTEPLGNGTLITRESEIPRLREARAKQIAKRGARHEAQASA